MGITTAEARELGRKLMITQRLAGVTSSAGPDESQTKLIEALTFDDQGNPTVILADGCVVGEIEAQIAVARAALGLPLTGDIPRTLNRINMKARAIIIGV